MLKSAKPRLYLGFSLLLSVIACNLFFYLWKPAPLQIIQNATFDQFQRLKPRIYQNEPVRIIDIDDASLNRLGQWPWPRTRIAELIAKLQSAKPAAMGLDIIFAEKDRTSPESMLEIWHLSAEKRQLLSGLADHDQVLADVLNHSNIALGFALHWQESKQSLPSIKANFVQIGVSPMPYLPNFQAAVCSLPLLEASAAGNGALEFISDTDGVIRKLPMVLRLQDSIVPSLVAESLRLAEKTNNIRLQSNDTGLTEVGIGNMRIPTSANGQMWINFSKPSSERYISAWRVLAGQIDPSQLTGKILLIGTSAQGLMDLRFSPLGGIIPGIEVHAQALEQILSGNYLSRPDWAETLEILIMITAGLLIGCITLISGAILSFMAFMLSLMLFWTAAWYAYVDYHWLLDPMIPSVMLMLIFMSASIFRHLYSERSQRWIKQAFSRYISPNLVEYLISHPEDLELGGHRQTCSFVFTDLSDFTGLMESLEPEKAVSLLNTYLENMIAIAFSHQGTLDRIVGDAVAIMFSAPLKQTDHQLRAIQCALDMQAFASQYCAKIIREGGQFGQTRIGVHSGEVIVGNFGGKTIFDYRALGDPVNTASRLEGANKYIGTLICVSETTLSACPEIPARPIGRVLLKGKTISLAIFEPLLVKSLNTRVLAEYWAAFILMRDSKPEALAAFQQIVYKHPEDSLAAFHLQRLLDGCSGDLIELSHK
ncbi:guanylate cyclase [Methylomonas lenta]|uniref:Guanylate cyclase n=1 Tax=Methylomonas lenta TaxID=980561 RepID=A0A177NM69_9GAMM|nr:adenylate/guanylate cyclase domain-containing protein [Methylomonas lenta]OAI18289.1 guanylate cyclase [Methylomonas lenta]